MATLLDFNLLEQAAAKAIDEMRFKDALRIYFFMSDGDASLDGGYLGEVIGQCYEALDDVPAARFWYGRAIEENPEVCLKSREARTRLGRESYDDLLKLANSVA